MSKGRYVVGQKVLTTYFPLQISKTQRPQEGLIISKTDTSYTLQIKGGWTNRDGKECWHVYEADIVGLAEENELYY